MKKLILPGCCCCILLILWLTIGSMGASQYESASNPFTKYTNDGSCSVRPTISGAPRSPLTPSYAETVPGSEHTRTVTLIYQKPELPNGCEITSLAMLLAWAGYPIDKVELSNNYLPMQEFSQSNGARLGPDPNQAFVGDPSSPNGWYCFEGPILEAANTYLFDQRSRFRAFLLSGLTQEELERCLDDGIPLAVWVTLRYAAPRYSSSFRWYLPDGTRYTPYVNLHCVVLSGWNGENYQIADPLYGWQTISPGAFWNIFSAMGYRAVAVLPS